MRNNFRRKELDRKPWVSIYFDLEYDDSQEFPWKLILKSTGECYTARRRKFVAQLAATELDELIVKATQ